MAKITSRQKNRTKSNKNSDSNINVEIKPEQYTAKISTQIYTTKKKIYKCCSCGFCSDENKQFISYKNNLYTGNDYLLPYCKDCINSLYENFIRSLDDKKKALERMCMLLDIYYSDSYANMTLNQNSNVLNFMTFYINKINNLSKKTYGDTIAEKEQVENALKIVTPDEKNVDDDKMIRLKQFWGEGFSKSEYNYLQNRYEEWISRNECKTQAQETIFKTISLIELQIVKAIQNGDKVDNLYKQLNDYMGSANIKPNQKNDNAFADEQCFGTLIEKWEQTRPIAEHEDSEIKKYISVWYLGHLCKMLNIKNEWSELYEQELEKYTCKPPDYKELDISELSFEDIFGVDAYE